MKGDTWTKPEKAEFIRQWEVMRTELGKKMDGRSDIWLYCVHEDGTKEGGKPDGERD